MPDRRDRFPQSVYGRGSDPDARFTLANERTFLAWIRTGLGLIAVGVALESLGLFLHPGLRTAAAATFIVAGILAPTQAWFGWTRVERALRENRPLPASRFALPLTVAVACAGVLVVLGMIVR